MRQIGVEPRLLSADWDRVPVQVRDVIQSYATRIEDMYDTGHGLVMYGKVGCGKSMAASLIVREAVKEWERTVKWWAASDLLLALENPYERRDIMRSVQFSALLVLDDFGTAVLSDQYRQWMDQIVDARYRRKKPTIITTNVAPDGLEKAFGPRIIDRWKQTMTLVTFSGGSQRLA